MCILKLILRLFRHTKKEKENPKNIVNNFPTEIKNYILSFMDLPNEFDYYKLNNDHSITIYKRSRNKNNFRIGDVQYINSEKFIVELNSSFEIKKRIKDILRSHECTNRFYSNSPAMRGLRKRR